MLAYADNARVPVRERRLARHRSLVVLGIFSLAILVALVAPRIVFALICLGLILHLRPEVRSDA